MFTIFVKFELAAFLLLAVKGPKVAVFVDAYVDDGMRLRTF